MPKRLEGHLFEAEAQKQLAEIKAKQEKRHAKSHFLHELLLLASSAALVGAIAFSYLQEAGFFGSADISQTDNQPRPALVSPPAEDAVIDLPTSLSPVTEVLTATVESAGSVIVTLTPEFHFPGFIGPAFTNRTAENLNNPTFWSVCQQTETTDGLAAKLLELGQALTEKLPPGGKINLCIGPHNQSSWQAVDKYGIPLWNQVKDAANPGTKDDGSGSWRWTLAPNDIPFGGRDWQMEPLSQVYQLKPGERWQRLTVDGGGGVMAEAVVDANGNRLGYFDPRDGKFHEVEPPATETPLPPALPTAKPGRGQPTATPAPRGEATATAVVPPKPEPKVTPDISECDRSRAEYAVCNVGGPIAEWNSQINAPVALTFDDPTIEGDAFTTQMSMDEFLAIVNAGEINLGTTENPNIRKIYFGPTSWSYSIDYDGTFHWTPNPWVWVFLQPK